MRIFLLQDVEKLGMAGQVVDVTDGYAQNFILPRKLGIKVTEADMNFYKQRTVKEKVTAEVLSSKVAMLAERIKGMHITIKERVHDDGKLYGAVGADEVVELLKAKEVIINRKQVEFAKAVKAIGEHKVVIKLSAKLKPELTLKVVAKDE